MPSAELAGVELYFEHLTAAHAFYRDVIGLKIHDAQPGHHVQFDTGDAFLCLEAKGVEPYPSRDKAVVFFKVTDLAATIAAIGRDRFQHVEMAGRRARPSWAVLHDPEGHNLLFLQAKKEKKRRRRS